MFVDLGRIIPQEFNSKEKCFNWFTQKQLKLKNSLRLLEKEKTYMKIRTPITNEVVTVYGEEDEIRWLHLELLKNNSFRI